jgi:hypothetical protein
LLVASSEEKCFVSVVCISFEIDDHGGRRGNSRQALTQWWHPVALSEVLDVLHWAMRLYHIDASPW